MKVRLTLAALLMAMAIACGKSSTPTAPTQSNSTPTPAPPSPTPSTCSISVSPSTQSVPIAGGTFSAAVTAGSGCTWTASRDSAWLSITAGATGTSNGTVSYTVQPDTSDASRSGAIIVRGASASASVAISQDGVTACTYTLSPSASSVPAAGGSFSFKVTR